MGEGMQEAAEEGEFVGARLDAGLRAARFASPPSTDDFAADVEPRNVPAVILLALVIPELPCLVASIRSHVPVIPCGGKSRIQVFRGVAKEWAASTRWDPLHGGLDYLLGKVGSDVAVEAMMSDTGHVFYGDLRSHERVSVPFSTFIQSCKSYLSCMHAASDSSIHQRILEEPTCSSNSESSEQSLGIEAGVVWWWCSFVVAVA
nr:unnamed protein product [Digitaria exilis]